MLFFLRETRNSNKQTNKQTWFAAKVPFRPSISFSVSIEQSRALILNLCIPEWKSNFYKSERMFHALDVFSCKHFEILLLSPFPSSSLSHFFLTFHRNFIQYDSCCSSEIVAASSVCVRVCVSASDFFNGYLNTAPKCARHANKQTKCKLWKCTASIKRIPLQSVFPRYRSNFLHWKSHCWMLLH